METSVNPAIAGMDLSHPLDALFVNAPLRDYSLRPRVNDFTLPVLGMGYIATYAARHGFNVGVIDAEALGLGLDQTAQLVNKLSPRWAGLPARAYVQDQCTDRGRTGRLDQHHDRRAPGQSHAG